MSSRSAGAGQCAATSQPTRSSPAASGRTAQYARLGQLELYYEMLGSGQPLVLIHGSLMTVRLLHDYSAPMIAEFLNQAEAPDAATTRQPPPGSRNTR